MPLSAALNVPKIALNGTPVNQLLFKSSMIFFSSSVTKSLSHLALFGRVFVAFLAFEGSL